MYNIYYLYTQVDQTIRSLLFLEGVTKLAPTMPGYKKIAAEITHRIHDGEYPSRSFLPSENELAREFDVTRTTIRKALNILKQQGTIESFQGKGYMVKSLYWEQSLLYFYSFGRNIADKSGHPKTKVISHQKIEGLKDVKEFEKMQLWEITRLRIMDNVPLILETSYLPVQILPEITPESLKQDSLYNLIANNKVQIVNAKEYLEPVIPSIQAQQLLEVESNNPLFQTLRYTYDSNKQLVELRESLIRGDHFRFTVEMNL